MLKVPIIFNGVKDMLINQINLFNFSMKGSHNPVLESIFKFSDFTIYSFVLMGFISGIFMIYLLVLKFNEYILKSKNSKIIFLFFLLILYCFIIFTQLATNRYYIPFMAILILLLLFQEDLKSLDIKIKTISISIFLILNFYNSIASAHDMMLFNRTRWAAIRELTDHQNISYNKIDGGFDFGAWNNYHYDYKEKKNKNWWWVEDDQYIVSYGTYENYNILKEYNYFKWLPPSYQAKIFILKRKEDLKK